MTAAGRRDRVVVLVHGVAADEAVCASLEAVAASGAPVAAVGFEAETLLAAPTPFPVLEPAAGPDGLALVLAALRLSPPADVLVLRAGARPDPAVYPLLLEAAYLDSLVATAAALPVAGENGTLSDERAVSVTAPVWGCVLVRRDALQLATATLDPARPSQSGLLEALEGLLVRPGFGHRLAASARVQVLPGELPTSEALADVPVRRAVDVIEAADGRLRVLVDGRCWAHPPSGTQVHVLHLVSELARIGGIELGVLLPPAVHRSLAADVAALPSTVSRHTTRDLPERRAHVFHRPFQLLFDHELAEITGLGHRLVITQQDMILSRTSAYFASERDRRRFAALTQLSFLVADHVAFFSDSARRDALSDGVLDPARTSVVPLGTDHLEEAARAGRDGERPPRGVEAGAPFVLVLGNAYLHKNRLYAIRLLERLAGDHGWDGLLVLAGERALFGGSEALERAYLDANPDTARRVADVGRVGEGEKRWLLRNAALVLYPTLYEGFGLVPFEAAALGTPCAYSRRSALGELLPLEGALLESWEPHEDAARVAEVLADPAAAQAIVDAVRAAARPLTWARTAAAYAALYRSTLAASAGMSLVAADDFVLERRALVAQTPMERRLLEAYRLSPPVRAAVDAALAAAGATRRWVRARRGAQTR